MSQRKKDNSEYELQKIVKTIDERITAKQLLNIAIIVAGFCFLLIIGIIYSSISKDMLKELVFNVFQASIIVTAFWVFGKFVYNQVNNITKGFNIKETSSKPVVKKTVRKTTSTNRKSTSRKK